MKALITGGAGFIGSHIAEHLINSGYDIVVLDNLSGGRKENIPSKARFINGSIADYEFLKELFTKEQFDFVYHLAAYAAESLSHFIRRFNYENNLIGSINLINLSVLNKVKCFVFTSSIAVYGQQKSLLKEKHNLQPTDPYGIAKLAVELDLKAAYKNFGLNSIVFRLHNVYGERQNINDPYRNVISIFIKQLITGMPMTIFGDGQQTRSFTYINDITPVLANAVLNKKAYNKIFNIGSAEMITVNKLADLLGELMQLQTNKKYLTERDEAKQITVSHSLITKYFDMEHSTTLKKGLENMVKWISKNKRILAEPQIKSVEIPFGLPEGW